MDEIDIRIIVEVELTKGWGGERWDVKDAIDERTGTSLGDIGIYEFDAYSDFPETIQNAVLNLLWELGEFEDDKFYSFVVNIRDGGSEIGQASACFWGKNINTKLREGNRLN